MLLDKIGRKLEGGLYIITGNEAGDIGNQLVMPEGTIHSVLTLQGGLLTGINWGTAEGLPLAATMLAKRMARPQLVDNLIEDFQWFTSVFKETVRLVDANTYPNAFWALNYLLQEVKRYPISTSFCREVLCFGRQQKILWDKNQKKKGGLIHCACGLTYKEYGSHFQIGTCSRISIT